MYVLNNRSKATRGGFAPRGASPHYGLDISIVLEAPIPKRSFGDKASLYVCSDKQQLSISINTNK